MPVLRERRAWRLPRPEPPPHECVARLDDVRVATERLPGRNRGVPKLQVHLAHPRQKPGVVADRPTALLPFLLRKKMGVVDSRNSSEIKGFSASAWRNEGSSSTPVTSAPVPALGVLARPSARSTALWVSFGYEVEHLDDEAGWCPQPQRPLSVCDSAETAESEARAAIAWLRGISN